MDFRHLNLEHKKVSLRKLSKRMRSNSPSVCLDNVQSRFSYTVFRLQFDTCLMMSTVCIGTSFVSVTAEDCRTCRFIFGTTNDIELLSIFTYYYVSVRGLDRSVSIAMSLGWQRPYIYYIYWYFKCFIMLGSSLVLAFKSFLNFLQYKTCVTYKTQRKILKNSIMDKYCWQWLIRDRPDLSSERAPHRDKTETLVASPKVGSIPRRTVWLTVSRNVASTSKYSDGLLAGRPGLFFRQRQETFV
jgi:hypothetical protein